MALWWQALLLLCWTLNCVRSSAPSPLIQRNKYNNSFRLTRSTRTRVQQLQKKYVSTNTDSQLVTVTSVYSSASPHLKSLIVFSVLTDGAAVGKQVF